MEFGIFVIESLGSTLAEIGETAKAAEEAGFDGLFVGENHFPEEGTPPENQGAWGLTSAPLVLCMAVAACTSRLRVGTAVLALPLHHAMEVAKQATALDILSEGRFVLGVGIGMEANGFREYGIPFVNRVSLLEEGVEVMRRAWTEEPFSITGRRYRLKDAALNVYPLRSLLSRFGSGHAPQQGRSALPGWGAAFSWTPRRRYKKPRTWLVRIGRCAPGEERSRTSRSCGMCVSGVRRPRPGSSTRQRSSDGSDCTGRSNTSTKRMIRGRRRSLRKRK